jgi:hypothetical protein
MSSNNTPESVLQAESKCIPPPQVGTPSEADKKIDGRTRPWENIVRNELDEHRGRKVVKDLFSAGDHHEFHTQSL